MASSQSYRITESTYRCFETISLILLYMVVATEAMKDTLPKNMAKSNRGRMAAAAVQRDLAMTLGGYLDCYLYGAPFPAEVIIEMTDKLPPFVPAGEAKGSGWISSLMIAALFSSYAEKANDWVRTLHGTDYANWPPVSNFARVIRNAIVHSQKVNMANPNAAAVSWRGHTISHADNGRKIIATGEYSGGDFIVLMLDLEDELNALGAPLPLV